MTNPTFFFFAYALSMVGLPALLSWMFSGWYDAHRFFADWAELGFNLSPFVVLPLMVWWLIGHFRMRARQRAEAREWISEQDEEYDQEH